MAVEDLLIYFSGGHATLEEAIMYMDQNRFDAKNMSFCVWDYSLPGRLGALTGNYATDSITSLIVGKHEPFELKAYAGKWKLRFAGRDVLGEIETDDYDRVLLLDPPRRAFLWRVDEVAVAAPRPSGCWFDPKIPKVIDLESLKALS